MAVGLRTFRGTLGLSGSGLGGLRRGLVLALHYKVCLPASPLAPCVQKPEQLHGAGLMEQGPRGSLLGLSLPFVIGC